MQAQKNEFEAFGTRFIDIETQTPYRNDRVCGVHEFLTAFFRSETMGHLIRIFCLTDLQASLVLLANDEIDLRVQRMHHPKRYNERKERLRIVAARTQETVIATWFGRDLGISD